MRLIMKLLCIVAIVIGVLGCIVNSLAGDTNAAIWAGAYVLPYVQLLLDKLTRLCRSCEKSGKQI